ncbi:hypothetical protein NM688_g8521 [Phlebia brevispora]|uniref:Uncharacterized protein n=1 Tax=Phlebia brevispora TaxID=194682 RepID=A0ACC1RSK2_9APHY|nr:hypothetical protein NM688_g8521 [Phlebia brevispora]
MHSTYARINNVSAFFSSCMMALLCAIALSSFIFTADPKGDLNVTSIQIFPGNARRYANKKARFHLSTFRHISGYVASSIPDSPISIQIPADLTPLFNWNTKQLFLYVQAEYTNAQGVYNEVVIWDKIIRSKEEANLTLSGRNKYVFRNLGKSWKNVGPANYTLKYNVMPYVGILTYGEAARTSDSIPFPEQRSEVA